LRTRSECAVRKDRRDRGLREKLKFVHNVHHDIAYARVYPERMELWWRVLERACRTFEVRGVYAGG
jgi:hypothetical protein